MTCTYTTECLRQKQNRKKFYFPFCGDVSKTFPSESYILDSNLEFGIHSVLFVLTALRMSSKTGSLRPSLLESKLTASLRT
jgi:hypothetical protein